jgi:hypothetical protein
MHTDDQIEVNMSPDSNSPTPQHYDHESIYNSDSSEQEISSLQEIDQQVQPAPQPIKQHTT